MNKNEYENVALAMVGENRKPRDWKEIFYQQSALQLALAPGVTVKELIQHSYLKWLGLMPAVLEKLNIGINDRGIFDAQTGETLFMHIDANSCALCRAYFRRDTPGKCIMCPIYQSRGEVRCDEAMDEEDYSPWDTWRKTGDPVPMLETLEIASEFAEKHPEMYQGDQYQRGDDAV